MKTIPKIIIVNFVNKYILQMKMMKKIRINGLVVTIVLDGYMLLLIQNHVQCEKIRDKNIADRDKNAPYLCLNCSQKKRNSFLSPVDKIYPKAKI